MRRVAFAGRAAPGAGESGRATPDDRALQAFPAPLGRSSGWRREPCAQAATGFPLSRPAIHVNAPRAPGTVPVLRAPPPARGERHDMYRGDRVTPFLDKNASTRWWTAVETDPLAICAERYAVTARCVIRRTRSRLLPRPRAAARPCACAQGALAGAAHTARPRSSMTLVGRKGSSRAQPRKAPRASAALCNEEPNSRSRNTPR